MKRKSHETVVGQQFGTRAAKYLTSAVHASGADLTALASLVRGDPDACLLDLGCGAGHVSFAVAAQVGSVVAYDLSPEMLEVVAGSAKARGIANLETRQGMAEHLPFGEAEFDIILSRYSAHHWYDLDAGLREAARVVKPGGMVGIVDTVTPGIALLDTYLQAVEVLRDPSHVRARSVAEWAHALEGAGLRTQTIRMFRVRLDFAAWVERMRTPAGNVSAILALQDAMADPVAQHFTVEQDGNFTVDVALFEAVKPA